jgi:hypothetical protein
MRLYALSEQMRKADGEHGFCQASDFFVDTDHFGSWSADPLWRRWRHLSVVVVWPDNKIHSFLHEELDLLDRLDISVPWEEFPFLL